MILSLALAALASPTTAHAQPAARLGFMAVGALTTASPAYNGLRFTEAYLTQPNLMGDATWRALQFVGTLNFEGYTLRRGELNAGMYGEGYVDRRHPHTFVHEAIVAAVSPTVRIVAGRDLRASLAAGKGFAPYGTDDPMMRPFVKYPVNHHHAQVIERALVTGALAIGDPANGRGAALELGVFNGDEPYAPFTAPRWSRVGDSHAGRLTLKPHANVELQASRAFVKSPGIVQGGAFDHTQASASARLERAIAPRGHGVRYAMLELARTDEGAGDTRAFRYESILGEAAYAWRGASLALRAESTERPEGTRLLDPFRLPAGHVDFQIIGVTRWRTATVHIASPAVALPIPLAGLRGTRFMPYVELARAEATARRRPSVFEPREFYGSAVQWSVTAGLRLHVGNMRSRMGRYGVLAPRAAAGHQHHQHP